jgi:hypothetical protein
VSAPLTAQIVAYDWKALAPGSVVVDVGGGLGTAIAPLARDFPQLQYVVQDLPGVIEEGKQVFINIPNYSVTFLCFL